MNFVLAAVTLSGILIALTISAVSLGLHWRHRDDSPAIAALSTRIQEVQLQILDLGDKVQHWRQRDSVRKARQGAQDKLDQATEADVEVPYKTQLRRRVLAAAAPKDAA